MNSRNSLREVSIVGCLFLIFHTENVVGFENLTFENGCPCNASTSYGCNNKGKCECIPAFYGALCDQTCACNPNGVKSNHCNTDGRCHCSEGYYGYLCEKKCNCYNCTSLYTTCDENGRCTCVPGFYGSKCTKTCKCENFPDVEWCDSYGNCRCSFGKYGATCEQSCYCTSNAIGQDCDFLGYCKCKPGWTDKKCDKECDCSGSGSTGFCDSYGYCHCKENNYGKQCNKFILTCGQMIHSDWYDNVLGQASNIKIDSFPSPWLVKIIKDGKFLCSGAVLTNKWILTLERCLINNGSYSIMVGDYSHNHYDIEEKLYSIGRVEFYRESGETTEDPMEKLALIRIGYQILNTSINITRELGWTSLNYGSTLQPICLNENNSLRERKLYMTGWSIKKNGYVTDLVKTIPMLLSEISEIKCPLIQNYETNALFCLMAQDVDYSGSTNYGNMLIYKHNDQYFLAGLWAKSDNLSKYDGNYFINVNRYHDWIFSNMS